MIERIYKIIGSVCFILIILILLLIKDNVSTGYEFSLYSSVSPLVGLFRVCILISGVGIVVYGALTKENEKNSIWLIGLLVLVFYTLIGSILPFLRGYLLVGHGDVLTHLGIIKSIIYTGNFHKDNFYPMVHLYIAAITKICGVSPITVMNYTPSLFKISYIFYMYILAKALFTKQSYVMLATTLAAVSPLGAITPQVFSFSMLPLIFYTYFKYNRIEFRILLIILLIVCVFSHPLTSFVLIPIVIFMELLKSVYSSYTKKTKWRFSQINTGIPLVTITTFFLWFSSYSILRNSIRDVIKWLSGEVTYTETREITEKLSSTSMEMMDIIELFFRMYGTTFVYLVLGLIGAMLLIKKILSQKKGKEEEEKLFTFLGALTGFTLLLLLLLTARVHFSPLRLLHPILICSSIFGGYALYELFKKRSATSERGKISTLKIITAIIIIVLIPTICTLQAGPEYTFRPNRQVTHMDMYGFDWFLNHKTSTRAVVILSPTERFADAILGYEEARRRGKYVRSLSVPDHFNYTWPVKGKYLVITEFDKCCYTKVWPMATRFNESDFRRLNYDVNFSKLYTNKELEVWKA